MCPTDIPREGDFPSSQIHCPRHLVCDYKYCNLLALLEYMWAALRHYIQRASGCHRIPIVPVAHSALNNLVGGEAVRQVLYSGVYSSEVAVFRSIRRVATVRGSHLVANEVQGCGELPEGFVRGMPDTQDPQHPRRKAVHQIERRSHPLVHVEAHPLEAAAVEEGRVLDGAQVGVRHEVVHGVVPLLPHRGRLLARDAQRRLLLLFLLLLSLVDEVGALLGVEGAAADEVEELEGGVGGGEGEVEVHRPQPQHAALAQRHKVEAHVPDDARPEARHPYHLRRLREGGVRDGALREGSADEAVRRAEDLLVCGHHRHVASGLDQQVHAGGPRHHRRAPLDHPAAIH
mmetsp:Transcript_21430/g.46995  ORF Transcript_21430/g.46995 Transcript_21430/m.46995 type:complete len:345 (-) Transcript_21430:1554-2588(-)